MYETNVYDIGSEKTLTKMLHTVVLMYTITWEEYAMKDLNALMLVVLLTTIVLCFFYHILFRNFLTSSTCVTSNCLSLNLGDILSSCLAVCIRTHFWSSVNKCSIHLAEVVSTYKLRFKMKCMSDSYMLTALAIFTNRALARIFNYSPYFRDICYSHRSTRFFF